MTAQAPRQFTLIIFFSQPITLFAPFHEAFAVPPARAEGAGSPRSKFFNVVDEFRYGKGAVPVVHDGTFQTRNCLKLLDQVLNGFLMKPLKELQSFVSLPC